MKTQNTFLLYVGAVLVVVGLLFSGCSAPPAANKPGGLTLKDKAADFSLVDATGNTMKLSDVQPGWYLVLIFYRGSWCGSCQNQLLNLKEDFAKFAPLHATLAAVSVDSVEDSAQFNGQWHFPFPLLSDRQFLLIDAYGLRDPKGHSGQDISLPAVIIIDSRKMIRYKYVGKSPADRPEDDEILYMIQQLQKISAQSGGAS